MMMKHWENEILNSFHYQVVHHQWQCNVCLCLYYKEAEKNIPFPSYINHSLIFSIHMTNKVILFQSHFVIKYTVAAPTGGSRRKVMREMNRFGKFDSQFICTIQWNPYEIWPSAKPYYRYKIWNSHQWLWHLKWLLVMFTWKVWLQLCVRQ